MTKTFRTLDDVDVKGKRVLLRVDLNVPMENGRVTDATRLERVAPTITEISAKGGKSLAEKDLAATALRIIEKAEAANCAIILPVDAVVAYHFAANAPSQAYGLDAIPPDGMILDVGPQSIARIHAAIDDAATLVWNGPLGAFEMTPFDHGTMVAARHAAARTKAKKLISVAGGGDTVAALNQAGVAGDFTYVSTAGGAFLEWMEGKPLPGVEVLKIRYRNLKARCPRPM